MVPCWQFLRAALQWLCASSLLAYPGCCVSYTYYLSFLLVLCWLCIYSIHPLACALVICWYSFLTILASDYFYSIGLYTHALLV
jgi:hypothetical protein